MLLELWNRLRLSGIPVKMVGSPVAGPASGPP